MQILYLNDGINNINLATGLMAVIFLYYNNAFVCNSNLFNMFFIGVFKRVSFYDIDGERTY